MADKRALFFLLLLPFFLSPVFLSGQEAEAENSFYIRRTGEGEQFIQRLVWKAEDYALRYRIVMEEERSGEYAEILREFRTENFIEVSLPPGSYRYRIQAYNFLNRPAGESAWIYCKVLPALRPEIRSVTQEFSSPETKKGDTEIILRGANLVEGAELYLLPESGGPVTPRSYLPAGESARALFDPLAPGRYTVRVKNPGGLEASFEITLAAPAAAAAAAGRDRRAMEDSGNPFDVYLSAEYAPLIPLYGSLFDRFEDPVYPLGFSLRAGFVPFKRPWGNIGLELAASWTLLKNDGGGETVAAHQGAVHLYGVYEKRLFSRGVLAFRLGAGTIPLYGTKDGGGSSESFFTWMPSLGGGLSFRWFFKDFREPPHQALYIEAGAEYTHVFSVDSPPPGFIKPALGIGWRF